MLGRNLSTVAATPFLDVLIHLYNMLSFIVYSTPTIYEAQRKFNDTKSCMQTHWIR